MAATVDPGEAPRWRRRAQLAWPLALVLLLVPVATLEFGLFVDEYDASDFAIVVFSMLPIALAIAIAGVAIGGRRGLAMAVMLAFFAVYCSWWFGWDGGASLSGLSVSTVGQGLADASTYLVGLLAYLWPFVLVLGIVVGGVAWRRRRRVWPRLGVLAIALVLLALPVGGSWDDGCNGLAGAVPILVQPFTQSLMDRGIGVLPIGDSTAMLCPDVGDREFKPFWLGGDGLPPARDRSTGHGPGGPARIYEYEGAP